MQRLVALKYGTFELNCRTLFPLWHELRQDDAVQLWAKPAALSKYFDENTRSAQAIESTLMQLRGANNTTPETNELRPEQRLCNCAQGAYQSTLITIFVLRSSVVFERLRHQSTLVQLSEPLALQGNAELSRQPRGGRGVPLVSAECGWPLQRIVRPQGMVLHLPQKPEKPAHQRTGGLTLR